MKKLLLTLGLFSLITLTGCVTLPPESDHIKGPMKMTNLPSVIPIMEVERFPSAIPSIHFEKSTEGPYSNELVGDTVKAKNTIKIGAVMPLSGDASAYGIEPQRIFNYQIEKINAVSEQQFELIYEDGKCSGNDAVSGFQKLTDIDAVKFVIGGFCSSETLAMAPLAENKNVLLMSPGSSNPSIEGLDDNIFTYSYSDELIGAGLATEAKVFKKVAIITEQNDFNIGVKDVFMKNIEGSEVEIVTNEIFPKGESDFRNVLEKITKSNPEAVILNANIGITAENLLRQAAEIPGWKDYQLISQVSHLPDATRESVGDFAEGMIIIDAPSLSSESLKAEISHITESKGTLDTLGAYYTAATLDDLNILTSLLTEFGEDVDAVKEALRERTFKGYISDEIYFGGHNFVQNVSAGKYMVEGGKAVYQD
ncbi:ABC transporter substrate-binding protein [Candidatus Peregrinibacteria bacterium]|jgi:branched-chain amino acid transport system substrate-binding protein|nr:ABC transporter substrate-binding protein [Candidatus Peregrinibacteria bacterium]